MNTSRLRIALLTHAVNPRGGVVHTLELARALHLQGHDVTIFAPAADGEAMFRESPCRVVLARLTGSQVGTVATVDTRIRALKAAVLRHDANVLMCVSDTWSTSMRETFGAEPQTVSNGAEERKNTLMLLDAFALLRAVPGPLGRFGWAASARRHLDIYRRWLATQPLALH